jgi:hypothetical protein
MKLLCALLWLPLVAWAQIDSVWSRTYGGSGVELLTDLCRGPGGSTLVCGFTGSRGAGADDFFLISMDEQGDTLWTRTYGGFSNERCGSLARRAEGGYFAACYTASFGGDLGKIWVLRMTDTGDTLWSHAFEAQLIYSCPHIAAAADGGCLVAVSGGADVELVHYAANGDSLWSHRFGSPTIEECHELILTADGGYLLGGLTYSRRTVGSDGWLLRTNADGDSLWQTVFGQYGDDAVDALWEAADGTIYTAGPGTPVDGETIQAWVTRFSAAGDSQSYAEAGSEVVAFAEDMTGTPDGGLLLGGGSRIDFNSPTRFWLKAFDANLHPRWERFWGENQMNWPVCLLAAPNGFLFGSTLEAGLAGSPDFYLHRFAEAANAGNPPPWEPVAELSANYPNPFNAATELPFELKRSARVTVTVSNLLGQTVATLVDGPLPAGKHRIRFNGAALASGVYLCTLDAGNVRQTRKMVLLK